MLRSPDFADVFVRCETAEPFETTRVIVGIQEIAEMRAELVVAIVVVPLDGRVRCGIEGCKA